MALVKVNEDLIRERKKCTFDVQELIYLIDGGEKYTQERKEIGMFYSVYYNIINRKETRY